MDDLTDLRVLNGQIQDLRTQRAIRLAEQAATEVRSVCPQASLVLFEGPQEPGGTVTILRLVDSGGSVIYDWEDETMAAGLEDDLTPAQDYLTGALEDDAKVFALGLGGDYVLSVPK